MAKKDFTFLINTSQSQKKEVNLESENQRLRETILSLKNSSINEASSQKFNFEDIKLASNIRDNYQYEQIEELAFDIVKNGQLQPVLITSDNFLLAGYRRYNAIKFILNNPEKFVYSDKYNQIVCYKLDKNLESFSPEEIEQIQYSENDQRRSIDHFHISNLFNKYLDKGYDQKTICEKFNKKKSYVSAVVSFKNIDDAMRNLIKEFQIYAWSKNKFNQLTVVNHENFSNQEEVFYEKNKGIIGWKSIYEISKKDNLEEQKKAFLKLFSTRLSNEELNSDYFKINDVEIKEELEIKSGLKYIKQFSTFLDKFSDEEKDKVEKIKTHLTKIEILLGKV